MMPVVNSVCYLFLTIFFNRVSFCFTGEKDCCDSLDYRGLDAHFTGGAENLPIVQTHINTLAPPYASHVKTYVDPHTYEDPHVAVRQFAKEIDSR